jgi:hypothetical protein
MSVISLLISFLSIGQPDGKWNPEAAGTRAGLPAAWMSMNPTQEVKNFVTNSQSDTKQ